MSQTQERDEEGFPFPVMSNAYYDVVRRVLLLLVMSNTYFDATRRVLRLLVMSNCIFGRKAGA
jgi:hypothetical protein